MLWCAVCLMAGIVVGLNCPLLLYIPILVACFVACFLTRKTKHWHDILTLFVWFLLGCSRATVAFYGNETPAFWLSVEQKAKAVQTALATRLERSGVSPQTLSLGEALVIGKKDHLDYETKESYRLVGASHLLALSGMHLGIIYGFLYFVFIRWTRFGRWRWHMLPPVMLLLWGYALVAGMPVSLVRAALMLSILTILSLMQYRTDPLHPLAMSAVIILLIAPADLLSISFQLSFVAVFFILTLWRPLYNTFPRMPWLVRLLTVSCIASFGTMPLVAFYFHRVALFGPFLSLILIPLTSVIIYLTMAAMLLPFSLLGWLLNQLVSFQDCILGLAGSISCASLTDIHLSKTLVCLMYGAMLAAVIRLQTRE